MKKNWGFFTGIVFALFLSFVGSFSAVAARTLSSPDSAIRKSDSAGQNSYSSHKNSRENEKCLRCHGQSKYSFSNKDNKKLFTKKMYSEVIIDRSLFYVSNHREFKCIDCHSEDYLTFPHAGTLRMETMPNCLDCHGGDPKYEKYHFENIEKEFQASVHSEKHSDEFTCWMCHNPHTYKINARANQNIKQTISYDNGICLNCHSNVNNYELLTDKQTPNLIQKHDWLPNQKLHLQSVRCIECHTKKINDSTLVSHKILPKKSAVKYCVECHNVNSVLMATLYRYQVKEIHGTQGFFRGLLANNSYVIGASRNYSLNVISIIIASLALVVIFIHALFRVIKK